jgi:hypothetical protein
MIPRSQSSAVRVVVRVLGAILLLFVGADHFYEYSIDQYSALPTIGTLFLLNFIFATAIGLILLAPLGRLPHRFGGVVLRLAAISGSGIAATSLVALLVSEHAELFGFMESNYRPAIIVAIAAEAAAALVLALLFAITRGDKRSTTSAQRRPRPGSEPAPARRRPSQGLPCLDAGRRAHGEIRPGPPRFALGIGAVRQQPRSD